MMIGIRDNDDGYSPRFVTAQSEAQSQSRDGGEGREFDLDPGRGPDRAGRCRLGSDSIGPYFESRAERLGVPRPPPRSAPAGGSPALRLAETCHGSEPSL